MHPELEKTMKMAFDINLKVAIPTNKIYSEIFSLRAHESRIRALEILVIKHIAAKEGKDEKEIYYEYEGLQAQTFADVVSKFLADYGR